MWVTALLSAAAFIATTVVMWSNSYFNSDYCSVREDPMFQIDPNNPETFHSYIWTVSSLLALTSVVISLINVRKHCKNYNYPLQQRYIIRILFLIPVYSILTLCSLILYRHYTFWLMIRDFYEGYAVYSFYWLLRYYLGDTEGLQTETIKAHQYHEAVEEMARFSEIESTGKRLGYFKQKKKASIQEFLDTGRKKFDMPGVGEIPYLRFNPTKRR